MMILGIETSCDETCISIYNNKKGIILNKIISQIKIHKKYGGIVPTIASKYHSKNLIYLLKKYIDFYKINYIAYTYGPGLSTSLIIGASAAITLSFLYNIPSVAINHIEGHIMSIMLNKKKPKFPFLCLLTSGANTYLIIVLKYFKYKILGKSIDNSAGEVFDKISYMIGLKYPNGKTLSKIAKNGKKIFNFPRPMIKKNNFNFSFSGLITYTKNILKNIKNINKEIKSNICFSVEDAITDVLVIKTKKALQKLKINDLAVVGGVSCNIVLRKKINKMVKCLKKKSFYTKKELCTDNAAMIALTGFFKLKEKNFDIKKNLEIKVKPKIKFIK